MADSQQEPKDPQAPDSSLAPVSASEPVRGEHLSANPHIEEMLADLQARLEVNAEYTSHTGPLPAPETYREYAEIIPDGANRIMSMAEAEQAHRHAMQREESKRRDREQDRADNGLKSASLIGVVGFTVAALFGALDHAAAGTTLAGATLVSLTWSFLAGTSTAKAARFQELREIQKGSKSPTEESKEKPT
jgi:uncharacterized membrane protein